MNDLITIKLSKFEALILATMIKEASDQLTAQIDELGQDERFFLESIQKLAKQLPQVQL